MVIDFTFTSSMLGMFTSSDLYEELAPSQGEGCLLLSHYGSFRSHSTILSAASEGNAFDPRFQVCLKNLSTDHYAIGTFGSFFANELLPPRKVMILIPSFEEFRYGVLQHAIDELKSQAAPVSGSSNFDGSVTRPNFSLAVLLSVCSGMVYSSMNMFKDEGDGLDPSRIHEVAIALADLAMVQDPDWRTSVCSRLFRARVVPAALNHSLKHCGFSEIGYRQALRICRAIELWYNNISFINASVLSDMNRRLMRSSPDIDR